MRQHRGRSKQRAGRAAQRRTVPKGLRRHNGLFDANLDSWRGRGAFRQRQCIQGGRRSWRRCCRLGRALGRGEVAVPKSPSGKIRRQGSHLRDRRAGFRGQDQLSKGYPVRSGMGRAGSKLSRPCIGQVITLVEKELFQTSSQYSWWMAAADDEEERADSCLRSWEGEMNFPYLRQTFRAKRGYPLGRFRPGSTGLC